MNKKFINNIIIVIFLLFGVYFVISYNNIQSKSYTSLDKMVSSIIKICKNQDFSSCYSKELAEVSNLEGMSFTQEILRLIQIKDQRAINCHSIAHAIATSATKRNPDNWKKLLEKINLIDCSYGFFHGILEQHISLDKDFTITPEKIENTCGIDDNIPSFSACVHIFGHLLVYNDNQRLENAIIACRNLPQIMSDQCFSGVFMEFISKMVLKDHAFLNENKEPIEEMTTLEIENLCKNYEGIPATACWGELGYRYAALSTSNPTEYIFKNCAQANREDSVNRCFENGNVGIAVSGSRNQDDINSLCNTLKNNNDTYGRCIDKIARSMIENSLLYFDRVNNFCSNLDNKNKERCYKSLVSGLKIITPEKFGFYCEKLSEYKNLCNA